MAGVSQALEVRTFQALAVRALSRDGARPVILSAMSASLGSAADEHDVRLLARVGQGNRSALAELYGRHAPMLFAYLRRLVGEPELAEEVLQDSFLAVWQGAGGFAGRSSVRVWLVGVARRQALRRLRRFSPELVELGEELGLVSPDSAVVVFERLDHAELLGVLGELRAVHREVLGLLLVEQLSYKEIAVVLGVPLGTVKSRVSNARRALAGLLARGSSAS